MPRVCVFDVNETPLDLGALAGPFARIFGDAAARQAWFQQLWQSALVATVTDAYADFSAIGRAAPTMTAERRGMTLSKQDSQEFIDGMRRLPPHPGARESLERLRDAGLRLAALTNSPSQVAEAQLTNTGLRDSFEQALSVDEVRRLKPAPELYRLAAERLGVPIGQIRLVAAHAWDVAGVLRAGCAAAFVARPRQVPDPLAPRPDVVGPALCAVAAAILERERASSHASTGAPPDSGRAGGRRSRA